MNKPCSQTKEILNILKKVRVDRVDLREGIVK